MRESERCILGDYAPAADSEPLIYNSFISAASAAGFFELSISLSESALIPSPTAQGLTSHSFPA